jgi:hypothetical protein
VNVSQLKLPSEKFNDDDDDDDDNNHNNKISDQFPQTINDNPKHESITPCIM